MVLSIIEEYNLNHIKMHNISSFSLSPHQIFDEFFLDRERRRDTKPFDFIWFFSLNTDILRVLVFEWGFLYFLEETYDKRFWTFKCYICIMRWLLRIILIIFNKHIVLSFDLKIKVKAWIGTISRSNTHILILLIYLSNQLKNSWFYFPIKFDFSCHICTGMNFQRASSLSKSIKSINRNIVGLFFEGLCSPKRIISVINQQKVLKIFTKRLLPNPINILIWVLSNITINIGMDSLGLVDLVQTYFWLSVFWEYIVFLNLDKFYLFIGLFLYGLFEIQYTVYKWFSHVFCYSFDDVSFFQIELYLLQWFFFIVKLHHPQASHHSYYLLNSQFINIAVVYPIKGLGCIFKDISEKFQDITVLMVNEWSPVSLAIQPTLIFSLFRYVWLNYPINQPWVYLHNNTNSPLKAIYILTFFLWLPLIPNIWYSIWILRYLLQIREFFWWGIWIWVIC